MPYHDRRQELVDRRVSLWIRAALMVVIAMIQDSMLSMPDSDSLLPKKSLHDALRWSELSTGRACGGRCRPLWSVLANVPGDWFMLLVHVIATYHAARPIVLSSRWGTGIGKPT